MICLTCDKHDCMSLGLTGWDTWHLNCLFEENARGPELTNTDCMLDALSKSQVYNKPPNNPFEDFQTPI